MDFIDHDNAKEDGVVNYYGAAFDEYYQGSQGEAYESTDLTSVNQNSWRRIMMMRR